jgi:CRISPR type IV-associated protein Csf3
LQTDSGIEIITEIKEQIHDYQCGEDFQPLQVSFKVRPPVFLAHPWLYFDSLIQYLCLRDALGEQFYILPSDITLPVEDLQIPIKKTMDVYHASVSQFDKAPLYQSTIYKRFNDKNVESLKPKQRKGKVHTDRGYFKDFMINLPFITPELITFYTCADPKEIKRLLPHLTHLGKKGAIGGGKILGYTVEEAETDYSFYKDGNIMRPIPQELARSFPLLEGTQFMNSSYKPPYWDKSNIKMCLVPKSQITVGLE